MFEGSLTGHLQNSCIDRNAQKLTTAVRRGDVSVVATFVTYELQMPPSKVV